MPQGSVEKGLRAAVAEVLTGAMAIRSWGRWFITVVRNPEPVSDEQWARFCAWHAAVSRLRARLSQLGMADTLDDAPCCREALELLLDADTGQSAAIWEEVVRTYGGRAVRLLLAHAPVPPRSVSLEYALWDLFGADKLVAIKAAELAELDSCGVSVIRPAPEAACG